MLSSRLFSFFFQKHLSRINCQNVFCESSKLSRRCSSSLSNVLSNGSRQLNCDIYLLNCDGSLQIDSGPFERAEICSKYSLEPRDLQKIDTDLHINVPLIDVRQGKFICFSFRRHRSLLQLNRCIFFVPSTNKSLVQPIGNKDSIQWEQICQAYHENVQLVHQIYNQRLNLPESVSIPFEFQMTDINLDTIAYRLQMKTDKLLAQFENVRERAYSRITISSLRELVLFKEHVDKHKRNTDLAYKAIVDVLAHDEDLIGMYLTDNRKRDLSDHIQMELLLEASTKQMAEVCRPISDLSDSVQTLENAIGFMLDAVRNELLAFEIRINIITMGLGLGALIGGIYGMNLFNGIEQHPHAFYIVTGSSICLITSVIAIAMKRLLRYRQIRLHRSNQLTIF